jgi:hypothetical protein
MKLFLPFILILLVGQSCSTSAELIELEEGQSMLILGKGAGQDALENPFEGESTVAIVNNRSRSSILARVITRDGTTGSNPIRPKRKRSLVILPGSELYLDSPVKSKVKITFKRFEVE